jgi:hypothetical protein
MAEASNGAMVKAESNNQPTGSENMCRTILISTLAAIFIAAPLAAKPKIDVDFCRRAGDWAEQETYKKLRDKDRSLIDVVSDFNDEQKEYRQYFIIFAKGILDFDYGDNSKIKTDLPDLVKKLEKLGAYTQRRHVSSF